MSIALVTGSAGLIGSETCRRLAVEGFAIVGLDNDWAAELPGFNSAKYYLHALHGEAFGVTAQGVSFDWAKAQARKGQVIDTLRKGIEGLMKKFKVEVVRGSAKLRADKSVEVNGTAYAATAGIVVLQPSHRHRHVCTPMT